MANTPTLLSGPTTNNISLSFPIANIFYLSGLTTMKTISIQQKAKLTSIAFHLYPYQIKSAHILFMILRCRVCLHIKIKTKTSQICAKKKMIKSCNSHRHKYFFCSIDLEILHFLLFQDYGRNRMPCTSKYAITHQTPAFLTATTPTCLPLPAQPSSWPSCMPPACTPSCNLPARHNLSPPTCCLHTM